MLKNSAGILFYRVKEKELQVLLLHPGGPFWKKRDAGAWTIPKGELQATEAPLQAALREVKEETGILAQGYFIELTPVKQKNGKIVHAFAAGLNVDPAVLTSNTFEMEWPLKSGKKKKFPEIDKAEWFALEDAETYMLEGQRPLLAELNELLNSRTGS